MQINYRLIDTYPDEHQVLVRFFSDQLPESALVSAWATDGVTPARYRTDYLVTLPIPAPVGSDFDAYILRHCPVRWFELKAKIADPLIDTSLDALTQLKGSEWVLTVGSVTPSDDLNMSAVVAATQRRLDEFAQAKGYDSILSACTYAGSAIPKFAAEGQCAATIRDGTWAALYTLLAEVQEGTRTMPTSLAEVEALLPALTWPSV